MLDQKYTVFGKVVGGKEVLEQLEEQPVNSEDRPLNKVVIEDVTVTHNPIADLQN